MSTVKILRLTFSLGNPDKRCVCKIHRTILSSATFQESLYSQSRWATASLGHCCPREDKIEFGLELHPDKTRLIEFGRFAVASRKQRSEGKPETFDFLGFTHICGQSRKNGKFLVLPKTMRLPLPKSRFLVHNVEINIRVATVRLETFRKTAMPTIRGVLRGAPYPGHPANQTYQIKEARHLTPDI